MQWKLNEREKELKARGKKKEPKIWSEDEKSTHKLISSIKKTYERKTQHTRAMDLCSTIHCLTSPLSSPFCPLTLIPHLNSWFERKRHGENWKAKHTGGKAKMGFLHILHYIMDKWIVCLCVCCIHIIHMQCMPIWMAQNRIMSVKWTKPNYRIYIWAEIFYTKIGSRDEDKQNGRERMIERRRRRKHTHNIQQPNAYIQRKIEEYARWTSRRTSAKLLFC